METFIDTWSLILFVLLVKQWIAVSCKTNLNAMTEYLAKQVLSSEKPNIQNVENSVAPIQLNNLQMGDNQIQLVEYLEGQLTNTKLKKLLKQLEEANHKHEDLKTKLEMKENMVDQMKLQQKCREQNINAKMEDIEKQIADVEGDKQRLKNRYFELENEIDELNNRTKGSDDSFISMLKKKASVCRWNVLMNNICFFSLSGVLLSIASKNLSN